MKRIVYFKKYGYNCFFRVTFTHKISCQNYPWWVAEKIEPISKYCYYKQNPKNRVSSMFADNKNYLRFPDLSSYFYNKILKDGEEA